MLTRFSNYFWFLAASLLLGLTACQPALLNPPRLATAEARSAAPGAETPTPVVYEAPTPTGEPPAEIVQTIPEANPNPSLTLWVNETSPTHQDTLRQMAGDIADQAAVNVEVIFIESSRLPELVQTAAVSGTLPDLIVHPAEYSLGWAEAGILDPEAASAALETLDPNTFDSDALSWNTLNDGSGQVAALPSNGWQQLWFYRQDWFDTLDLPPPVAFTDIISGAQAVYRNPELSAQTGISETLISGIVVPTESDLMSTQWVFEHLATANGCELIDEQGEVLILDPACQEALDFYRQLVNGYSPSDIQTDTSALNAYLAGRTGIIVGTPEILIAVAGLDDDLQPSCPECVEDPTYLIENTGLNLAVSGFDDSTANFGQVTNIGVTTAADPELAQEFLSHWFNEGYLSWLAVDSIRKVPLRTGQPNDPQRFLEAWQEMPLVENGPTLAEVVGDETAEAMMGDIALAPRWGFAEGQGGVLAEVNRKTVFPILLQEMLSGYFVGFDALAEGYERVVALIPNYAYYIEPVPTVDPETADDA